ncbi:putative ribonuclease H-like domain-containing protein [Tanacetum coccineum]
MAGSDDENPPPPPPQTPTQQAPHIVPTIKLLILKKGEYDIWAMKIEHYLSHTDYPIWEVIQKGNGLDAIKSRFGGNDESKKMQKYILKQQFEDFFVSNSEGLHKGYDRSLTSSWSQVSLVMRTKPGVDSLSFDDLYNNLRVFEFDVKGSTGSSSSAQNVAVVSFESTSSTNDVSIAYGVSTSSGYNSQRENSSSYTDELILKKFYNKTGRRLQFDAKEPAGFDKTKVECFNCHKTRHFARECRSKGNQESRRRNAGNTGYRAKDNRRIPVKQEEPKALVTLNGEGVDWTGHVESYAKLKKLYDEQREQLGDASIEIQAYTQALKKVEAQLVAHQKNQLWSSDVEDSPVNDRFANVEAMHAVPPPMIGNYMPLGPDREVDDSMFIHGLKQSKTSESDTQTSNFDSCESNSNVETLESMPEPVVVKPKVVSQPKVWFDALIIKEYESDIDDEYVIQPLKEQEKPSFAFVNTVKHVKTPRETIKEQNTYSPSPKADKIEWNGLMSKRLGLGYRFTKKTSLEIVIFMRKEWLNRLNLIRDCDFHEKRMAKQAVLNNRMKRNSTVLTSAAMKVNTVKPIVNRVRPTTIFHKTHSPFSKPFNKTTALRTNFLKQKVNTAKVNVVSAVGGKRETAVKPLAGCNWRPQRHHYWKNDYLHRALQNKVIVDSGCSRHMTVNKAYIAEYQDFNGGPVAFGGSKGYITGKGKIKTGKLDFEDVCFVKELQHFNLFSVSQMCDKKNKVLFTDSECLVLSPEFKLPDENQVLLRIPRQNNMYSFNLENIVPSGGLACLIAKATIDESNKWHRRLGHVNFKNLNKLVKGNLVRGLPSKIFQNDHTCVACQKGKQHKASCKAKSVSSISHSLQLLHMDLFGPTSVRSLNHKTYCLVITDDFSRFSWVFFLRTKDETSGILKDFIRQIENQLNQKVKTIRCDNGTEFKNRDFIEFCGSKGIKREYSNARTPQQNGVAERKNMTLIEAARTMLADSFLPNTFWAEAVSTACYVLNRVLVTKPHNKTPYELVTGKIPIISYIRPFGCHVTILNTIDHLGKFDGKSDEGFLVGYSLQSKAFRRAGW